jgi:hypothetical protein
MMAIYAQGAGALSIQMARPTSLKLLCSPRRARLRARTVATVMCARSLGPTGRSATSASSARGADGMVGDALAAGVRPQRTQSLTQHCLCDV